MTAFVIGLVGGAVLTAAVLPFLRRWRLVDVPNARSSHAVEVPRGGGLAVMAAVVVASLTATAWGSEVSVSRVAIALCGSVALAAVGLVDDLSGLGTVPRLAAQAAVGLGSAILLAIGRSPLVLAAALVLVGACWIVASVNAVNFMDGINGITALTATVAGGWYGWLGHENHDGASVVLGLALAGAALGFLPFNAPRARLFLGDVGSYGVGCLIAVLALMSVTAGANVVQAVAPLSLYLADTGWALVTRASRGESIASAHRDHVYQRLVDGGWSHLSTAVLVACLAVVVCLTVALSWPVGMVVGLALAGMYLSVPARLHPARGRAAA